MSRPPLNPYPHFVIQYSTGHSDPIQVSIPRRWVGSEEDIEGLVRLFEKALRRSRITEAKYLEITGGTEERGT